MSGISSAILYYLFIIPLSILPFWVLYIISDILYVILYLVLGYRKKVVLKNLRNSFPEKSNKEIKLIAKKFYSHFCDIIIESVKLFTLSKKDLLNRVYVSNPQVSERFAKENKSIVLVGGHYGNWECSGTASNALLDHKVIGIYKPLTNQFFDKKLISTRSKHGTWMVSMKKMKQIFKEDEHKNIGLALIGDQSPSNIDRCYWTTFLNQPTGVMFGAEKYAKEYDMPVVYFSVIKIKRGHYRIDLEVIAEDPKSTQYGEITEAHTQLLEKKIMQQPEFWLWTHKRWKHKPPTVA